MQLSDQEFVDEIESQIFNLQAEELIDGVDNSEKIKELLKKLDESTFDKV